jgi:outer membrane protein TolC
MKSRIIFSAVLLAAATTAYAQPSADEDDADVGGPEAKNALPIQISEVVTAIINLSPDLARARTDRSIAKLTADAERKHQAWVVSANAGYQQNGIADHVEAPPYSVVEQDTLSGTIGLGRNLPTGGSIQFETGIQHQHTEYNVYNTLQGLTAANATGAGAGAGAGSGSAPPTEEAFQITSHAQLQVKQPLARGLGEIAVANEKKADLAATEATVKVQLAAEDTLKEALTDYWELAYSNRELDIRFQAIELAKKQMKITHDQARAGTVSSTAIDQVRSDLYEREAAFEKTQIDVEARSMELRRKAGLDLQKRGTVLKPGEAYDIGEDEFDITEVLQRAKTTNRKLASLVVEQRMADVDIEVAADAMKPQVDLTATGALVGIGETSGDSVGGLGKGDGYQLSLGLSVQWEVSGAARKGRDAAQAKKKRLGIDLEDASRQIETNTVLAVKQVSAARRRVELSRKAEAVSDTNVRSEKELFIAGRTTNYNVMQRQASLITARLNLARAIADYHLAVIQLQYLSGTLLDQYGVDVKPHGHR